MKNVLVVGRGGRVQGAILPALQCLQDDFNITAVYSRSSGVSLGDLDFSTLDLIIVAVTLQEVPNVLRALTTYATKHITLMLDTPVLAPKDILATRYFKKFKKVLVSEDTIALPPFLLARKLIEEGKIGKLKSISFFHNGYKYHALASLKMLVGERDIISIRSRKLPEKIVLKEITFPSGIRASLFEPRDYSKGKFLIEGDAGCIADYACTGPNVFQIGYVVENKIYKGLTLGGERVRGNEIDAKYAAHISDDLPEKSLMNSMKVRALMDLLLAATKDSSPFHYAPALGIYDNLAMLISERGYFRDCGFAALLRYFIGHV